MSVQEKVGIEFANMPTTELLGEFSDRWKDRRLEPGDPSSENLVTALVAKCSSKIETEQHVGGVEYAGSIRR